MSFWCDNKLTITGPNRELVLNAVKRETTDEGEPLTIFFSLEALRRSAEAKARGALHLRTPSNCTVGATTLSIGRMRLPNPMVRRFAILFFGMATRRRFQSRL